MRVRKLTSSKLFKLLLVLVIVFAGYQILVKSRLSQTQPIAEAPLPAQPAKATAEIDQSFVDTVVSSESYTYEIDIPNDEFVEIE